MKKVESRREDGQIFFTLSYENPQQAIEAYASLTDEQRGQMAQVYQEAFGGYPWFEIYKCNQCTEFAKTNGACGHCGNTSFSEAYPIDWLVKEYFPHMVSEYTPGLLVTLEHKGRMVGFTTGGAIELKRLVENKYQGKSDVLTSIVAATGITPDQMVFYENETCVSALLQQKGSGGRLNLARVQAAAGLGFPMVCGRTINQPWLRLKERQLAQNGYDFFIAFNPQGDTYEVDGVKRQFFMAIKNEHG